MSDLVKERKTVADMTVGEYRDELRKELDAFRARRAEAPYCGEVKWFAEYRENEVERTADAAMKLFDMLEADYPMVIVLELFDRPFVRELVASLVTTLKGMPFRDKGGRMTGGTNE